MSMRYVKKVQSHNNKSGDITIEGKNTKTSASSPPDDDDDDGPMIDNVNGRLKSNDKSFNVFNLFTDISGATVDDDDDDDDNANSDQCHDEDDHNDDEEPTSSVNNKDTKKKQKNKKKKRKKRNVTEESIDYFEAECNELLEPINLPSSSNSPNLRACLVKPNILQIQQRYLNADNELRKLCGRKMVAEELNIEQRRHKKLGSGNRFLKRICLTESCKWSPSSTATMKNFGLSMSLDNDPNNSKNQVFSNSLKNSNVQCFVFLHDTAYRDVQKKFFAAVESKNPENIIGILAAYPFHVDSLLQVSEIFKLNEDLRMSAEYVERALRCLEFAFHPSFNVLTGNCRLSYKKQTNRALFIALFRHLTFVAGRACYRTSLELCKVLLSFDSDNDPLACVLIIDWLAIRSKEHQWFIDFCQASNAKNLTQLPSIAYSLALAHFRFPEHRETADELLQNALFMFPHVLPRLIEKCSIKPDKKVLNHTYFFNNEFDTSTTLKKLQDLYVVRAYYLWRDTSILAWLEQNVHTVIDKIDSGQAKDHMKYCKAKRKTRYQAQLPRNIARHIILSDIKEVTLSYPEIQKEDDIFSYDPLPPADSIDIYDNTTRLGRAETGTNTSTNSNFLSAFISSLFPGADENGPMGNLARLANHHEDEREEFD